MLYMFAFFRKYMMLLIFVVWKSSFRSLEFWYFSWQFLHSMRKCLIESSSPCEHLGCSPLLSKYECVHWKCLIWNIVRMNFSFGLLWGSVSYIGFMFFSFIWVQLFHSLVEFYVISTFVDYLIPNPVYT